MDFRNTYQDSDFAAAYAKLEFPGTYFLAFRDLPEILARHVAGRIALDFGCGAGLSTRFLRQLSFDTLGVDIADEMIRRARATDPAGDYRQIADGDLSALPAGTFDLVLSAFPFDNIPTWAGKMRLFREMARMLKPDGRIVNLVSSPEIYWHEWASFSTKQFPENRQAKCGDPVRIINTAIGDSRPTVDILWPHDDYVDVYRASALHMLEFHRPLGRVDEPYDWVNETRIAPWVIYVLEKTKT